MRAWRSRIILLAAIVLLPLEGVLLWSMWPYLSLVGQAIAGLFITCCVCGAIYAVALTRHHIALQVIMLRHADLRSRTIDANGVVVVEQEDGSYRHLSAEHEAAKLLPAQASTISITEAKAEAYSPGDLEILSLVSQGQSQADVAKACSTNQTYVSRLVRRWKAQNNMVD